MKKFRRYNNVTQEEFDSMDSLQSYGKFIVLDEVGLSKIDQDVLHESYALLAREISEKMT